MWPFSKKETSKIKKTVKNVADFVVDELKEKGLVSLYIGGTILCNIEREKHSQIDLFGLVSEDFKSPAQKRINTKLKKVKKTLCGGYEVKFVAVPLKSFETGKGRGLVKTIKPERLIQRFSFFKHHWGKKYNFKKHFPLKPMDLKEEAIFLMKDLTKTIKAIREGKEKFPFEDFPKHVIELVRVEAQLFHNFKFDPSRLKLVNHLREEELHVVHTAMTLRKEHPPTRERILSFCNETERYIAHLRVIVVEM